MAVVSAQKMSDSKLASATGMARADWHAVLEAAGARDWKHPMIASWLQSEHGVDGWWAQGITVGYEQAIGRRLPGQTADGSFSVSVTKTINGSRAELLESVLSTLQDGFGEPVSVSPDSIYSTVTWKASGETTVAAISEKAAAKTLVSLTRSKIVDVGSLDAAKKQLNRVLDALLPHKTLGRVD